MKFQYKSYKPMLSKIHRGENVFTNEYIFEPKLDGYRALCYKNSSLRFISRNGNNLSSDFPELQSPKNIKAKYAVIDGEIVIYNEKGLPDFNLIQNRQSRKFQAFFVAFDILMKDGVDLTSMSLLERKKILSKTVIEKKNFQIIFFTEKGEELLRQMKKQHIEGIMAKKKNSLYMQSRSSDWIKIKFVKTIDCVIIGYTSQKKEISSLLLGLYKKERLIFVGKVGTGFNQRNLPEIKTKIYELKTEKYMETDEKKVIWLKPSLVAEVKYTELTPDKKLRAPVFLRLRDDKNPEECGFDQV